MNSLTTYINTNILLMSALSCMTLTDTELLSLSSRQTYNDAISFIGLDAVPSFLSKEIADKPFITPEDFGKELEEIMGTNNNVEIE